MQTVVNQENSWIPAFEKGLEVLLPKILGNYSSTLQADHINEAFIIKKGDQNILLYH